jgi:hypothetical protein
MPPDPSSPPASPGDSFEIKMHTEERILEVVYPPQPSDASVEDYLRRVRRVVEAQKAAWGCLVDQRQLRVLSPGLFERIADLNRLAEARGMKASARVVGSAVAGLQAGRIARTLGRRGPAVRAFEQREAALAWLREQLRAASD